MSAVETVALAGDVPGVAYELRVHRLAGRDSGSAPAAYLQAALHADELPGVAALHALLPMLRTAEAAGRLRGDVTVVPVANPLGRAQFLLGGLQGRFHIGSGANFNRGFPLLPRPDPALLPPPDAPAPADRRLKALLLGLALGHEIVLDLHCDDVGLPYVYAPLALWPGMADLPACLGMEIALTWDDAGGGAFEEAAVHPYLPRSPADAGRRVASTVELRGRADVGPRLAAADADGLYRFLVGRGVVEDPAVTPPPPFAGHAVPLENVEMLRTPVGGMVLYHVGPGDRVAEGDLLATVVATPGEAQGAVEMRAPQAGLVAVVRAAKLVRAGEDLLKLLGTRRSATARPGPLDD